MNKNKAGLVGGIFLGVAHLLWALAIAVSPSLMQSCLDFIFRVHFISNGWKLSAFNIIDAVLLVVITFVIGYILGWLFALIVELTYKKKR
ncbi:MAG: hypothetical protein AABW91_02655 [Nanoarchaeota archaeon]